MPAILVVVHAPVALVEVAVVAVAVINPIRILAVSGSLRKASYNSALIRAMAQLAPSHIHVDVFEHMADVPLFNPDIDVHTQPVVMSLKTALKHADGLLIASPEYAHGISGVLKNALDWLVDGEEFVNMNVALINASPRASHAQAALREVITTMSGRIIESASIALPLLGSELTTQGMIEHPSISQDIRTCLHNFADALI